MNAQPKSKTKKPAANKHAFQAEVQQLLHLIIHSLYSNREIFLRELISNASDACDRLRFTALTDKKLHDETPLGVWLSTDKKANTISIRDNGIGMTADEVVANIGTIARSGTRQFLEQMQNKDAKQAEFIGQFGVGFYSAFLVAKTVVVETRKAGSRAGARWESDGGGEYILEKIKREQTGTEITLHLKDEHKEFLEKYRLTAAVEKYCDHISLPIHLLSDAKEEKWENINRGSALWTRAKKDINKADYDSFYASFSGDPEPPAVVLHNRVEGAQEYISLFFIAARAPFDLWDRERTRGIKLYVRRIFITEDTKLLLPNYLRFVRGLIDSADLPLNVSREFLQQNKVIDKIRAASVKKILTELQNIATNDAEKYASLWQQYGRVLKEGILEDFENKNVIAELLRFASTYDDEDAQKVSLNDYIKRMPTKQKAIYYVTADSFASAKNSPHLEAFRKNKVEVLLLHDAVDEWLVGHLTEYKDKQLQSIAKGDLDKEVVGAADTNKDLQPLLDKIKTALGERVKDVRVSNRLVDSPACLVADANELGANMQRILQSLGQSAPATKPILEINPKHAIIMRMQSEVAVDEWAAVLFDHAALAEGATLQDPNEYLTRIHKLLARS